MKAVPLASGAPRPLRWLPGTCPARATLERVLRLTRGLHVDLEAANNYQQRRGKAGDGRVSNSSCFAIQTTRLGMT
jgi:hypothetical protein